MKSSATGALAFGRAGLKAETIPLPARIFCIADVYDALTSNQPYWSAGTKEETLEYIAELLGKHFAPRIVEVFLKPVAE